MTAPSDKPSFSKPNWHHPILMWTVAMLFIVLQFYCQLSSGVMLKALMKTFNIHALDSGLLSSAYFVLYVLLQAPAGMLADRFGARRLITGGSIICAIGSYLFATSHNVVLAEIARMLMGTGSAVAYVCGLQIVSDWFAPKQYAFMVGFTDTFGMMGTVIINFALAQYLDLYGWRSCMLLTTLAFSCIALAAWHIILDKPSTNITKPLRHAFIENLLTVFKQPALFWNGLYTGVLFSVVTVFSTLWGIPYLRELCNISLPMATLLSNNTLIGVAIGAPIFGWFFAHIRHIPNFLAISAGIGLSITCIILYYPTQNMIIMGTLLFILGLACSAYVVNFALVSRLVPSGVRSTAIGYTNMICVGFAPILQPLVGWIIDAKNTARLGHFTLGSLQTALSILPIIFVCAIAFAYLTPRLQEQQL